MKAKSNTDKDTCNLETNKELKNDSLTSEHNKKFVIKEDKIGNREASRAVPDEEEW